MPKFNLLVILGLTASGKTKLAVQLARQFDGEILSADSRQVYRGLDIGSGKDLEEYEEIPYHLIDIVDPGYEFNIFDFQNAFFDAFEYIEKRKKLPVMAGGSALYVDSILNGYRLVPVPENVHLREQLALCTHEQLTNRLLQLKPNQHNTTDLLERERLVRAIEIAEGEKNNTSTVPDLPKLTPMVIGIHWERSVTRKRITQRLKFRLENGLIEEVEALYKQGVSWQTLEYYGLEYRLVAQYLQNQLSREYMFEKLNIAIHQFSKKQATWLRRLQKNGLHIHWVDGQEDTFKQSMTLIKERL
ncbi:MAG: tRNA (adenosine(37)-N6)-dimethylallyltransferase MiaA [Gammaproteobacteria bacterium]|nr:tRNA (adenosine(37)-N6)-dimethylallyltransferase MiaA [Gammaproteobacteria bacterium]